MRRMTRCRCRPFSEAREKAAMSSDRARPERRNEVSHWLALVAIMAGALAVRFWQLDALPPGVYRDEAINGLDALRVIAGERPIFFTANNGREPLYIYLLAASIHLLGRSPGALRIVSALLGTVTVAVGYALGRQLYGARVGLAMAALLAAAAWPVNLSRIAFRAGALPLFQGAMLALLWSGLRRRSTGRMVVAGLCWGAAFYTYLAARFTLVAMPLLAAYLWWRLPSARWPRGWLWMALAAILVAAPLGLYIATHWQATMGRATQVSVFDAAISGGHPWRALWRNVWGALLGPFVRGDFIPRHNIPLRPAFGVVMAPVGLLGLVVLMARARRDAAAALALIWCVAMALPTVLAENAPHFLRAVGVLPVLYLWPAVGLAWLADRVAARCRRLAIPLMTLALAAAAVVEVQAYAAHLRSEAVYYNFESGATELAAQVNRFVGAGWQGEGLRVAPVEPSSGRTVAVDRRLRANYPALDYLMAADTQLIDLEQVQPGTSTPLVLAVWPYGDTAAVISRLPSGQVLDVRRGAWERGDLETEARPMYLWVQVGAAEPPTVATQARWAGGIVLEGYTLDRHDGQIDVALWWRAEQPVERDYTVFCQAIDQGALVGQADGQPALGLAPTSIWHAHSGIVDRRVLSVDNDGASHSAVHVGLYDLATMERLPLVSIDGEETNETQLVLQ